MPMYSLIEHNDNYLKTTESWQYCKDEPAISNNGIIIDFPDDPDSVSCKYKQKITGQTGNYGTKDVQIIVPLKNLSNFWRTFELPLINCEINVFFTWSAECIIVTGTADNQEPKFAITDTKLYVPVVSLSAQDNSKLLQQLKTGFKRTINWNKYQSKPTLQTQNRCLNYLIDPSFQGVNRLFVLSFENYAHWRSHKRYFLPTVKKKTTLLWSMKKTFLIIQ